MPRLPMNPYDRPYLGNPLYPNPAVGRCNDVRYRCRTGPIVGYGETAILFTFLDVSVGCQIASGTVKGRG